MYDNSLTDMAVFNVRLPDDLAARFDAMARSVGGRSALLRKLIDRALHEAGDTFCETAVPRTRTTDRLQLRLMREDIVQLDAAADARGLKRTEWLVMLLRRRLHATSPPPHGDRVVIAQSWRELNRIGINLNQAVHALHAATMVDSRLDLAREAARVASFRDEVAEQLRVLGRALKGDLAYWDTADE
ncbi:mobilization protein MobC [Sphingobium sp. AEW010]|nr:mobilization protein [Sphingobium sp. AEW4]TWD03583.1 mobilization protein MobC [Sphingobium sp. AEW010]TWD21213.1 mobilization protein MobC [Sphingobium sp. AEW013]TWD23856.1 mobilization protein MobC [Sphingobium sp. AEW001]